MSIRYFADTSLTAPDQGRSWPLIANALHDIPFAATPAAVGQLITSIPTTIGNTVSVESPPTLARGEGFVLGDFDGLDDQIRLAQSPAISMTNFTIMIVAAFKVLTGYQSLFYGMPPGGDRSDLSLNSGVLTFVGNTSGTAIRTHPWTPDTKLHIFEVTQASAAVTIGVDGVEASGAVSSPLPISSFNIGQKRGGGFTGLKVGRAVILPGLNAGQRATARGILAGQFGIKLP